MSQAQIVRIPQQNYIHVLDQTTNITRVEKGPQTLICKQHEAVVSGPHEMITIPPRHYVIVENPITVNDKNQPTYDEDKLPILRWGQKEIRLAQDPFPLFPGEKLIQKVTPLQMVYKNEALHLLCAQDFKDEKSIERRVGDEWLFYGPGVYVPHVNVDVVKKIPAIVIKQNEHLRLRAIKDCIDGEGNLRTAGEEWIVSSVGAYLPGVYEQQLNVMKSRVLTDKKALHIKALRTFTDQFGHKRLNGQQWLVTYKDTETYVPSVNEDIARFIDITTLSSRQYCVIDNPYDETLKTNRFGAKKLVVGEKSFFLHPGEKLANGIESVYVLNEEEGLVLTCVEAFVDEIKGSTNKINRRPGDRWLLRGPMEFIPPIGAKVLKKNKAIALGENEGIYVRNIKTGIVRAVIGTTYLLNENEELWEKILPPDIEELLASEQGYLTIERARSDEEFRQKIRAKMAARDKTRVIRYDVPHNNAVQIYDYREKKGRVVFGPALVLLQPGEVMNAITLSGSKPKKPNSIRCLHLRLGPEFSSDIISVETSDHARLQVELSYNWKFNIKNERDDEENSKLFAVEDFIGDLCKAVSSHVRAAVSQVPFDEFHKTSAKLIRKSVFGVDENNKIKDEYYFPANNLILTGIDIRSIEPEDPKTREALQKSIQLSIEITAKAQEAVARHQQNALEQQAKGRLERQRLIDQSEAEESNKTFMQVQADNRAVETAGQARAIASSKAEMLKIAAKAAVDEAKLHAQAKEIEINAEIEQLNIEKNAEIEYLKQKISLQQQQFQNLADIEVKKFSEMCKAIGSDTLQSISLAGPELRAKILKGLGIEESFLSDGSIPFL